MAISLGFADARLKQVAEDSLRVSIVPMLRIVAPTALLASAFWYQIDRPGAPAAAATLLAVGCALGGMALRWHHHPPESAHLAATATIALLFVSATAQLLAYPDPALGSLHIVVLLGAAAFLTDLRWLIGVELFGAATWVAAVALAPPSSKWALVGYVLVISSIAGFAWRLAHVHSLRRISDLAREGSIREYAIELANAALRNAQRIAGVGSYEWDPTSDELRWSDEHYRIFGWEPGEPVSSKRFFEAIVPEDQPELIQALARSLNDDVPVDVEFRILTPNGQQLLLHGLGETTRDASGKPIMHAGTSRDITAGRSLTEALHTSEGRLKAILTALELNKVVAVDRDGTVVSLLGYAQNTRRYGVEADEVPGRSIHDFVPGDAGDRLLEAVERTYQTGEGEELEASVEFPMGTFAFDVSLRALLAGSGAVESVLAIVRDVTQRKATERALEHAQKLESLGVLAGGIAHDFNNLLVGILGNADTALQTVPLESLARSSIEDVIQAGERAADLTQQLLAYAGKAEVSIGPVNLAELVYEMIGLLRANVAGKATLEVEPGSENVWVRADATQIRQVVMNFITNASEALQSESGQVRVRTGVIHADRAFLDGCHVRDDLTEGDFALLEVSDDGCGMDPETEARIFDPFFTTKFQGRGLGLASTLGIVRSHRGAVRVASEPGVGTTVQVLLPLAGAPEIEPELKRSSEPSGGATILVVDDEDMVRVAAARMVNALGHETIEASSGAEAVDAIKTHGDGIAAVLLDLTMPEMDGDQTLAALRTLRSSLPVVLMSGHSDLELADRMAGIPFATYVRKPFRLEALRNAIESILVEVAEEPRTEPAAQV